MDKLTYRDIYDHDFNALQPAADSWKEAVVRLTALRDEFVERAAKPIADSGWNGPQDTPVAIGAAANQFALAVREATAIRDALEEALSLFRQGQQRLHTTTVVEVPAAGLTIDPQTGVVNGPDGGGIFDSIEDNVKAALKKVLQDEIEKARDLAKEADENAARVINRDVKREPPGYDWPKVATLKDAEAAKSEERFPAAERFIFDEMKRNIHREEVHEIWELLHDGDPLSVGVALKKWYDLVATGKEWDHKPKIEEQFGLDSSVDKYFKIPGDARGRELFYDVWSNIHYGYVGSAAGFSRWALQTAANSSLPGVGETDDADVASVDLGVDLWESEKGGPALPFEELHAGVLRLIETLEQLVDEKKKVTQLRVWQYSPEVLRKSN